MILMFYFILFLFIFLILIYASKIIYFYRGLFKLRPGKNQKQFFVTVLVPARNEEQNISSCLDSLVKQNYPPDKLEIIVIDDDSDDRTGEIVEWYTDQYPFIRLISLGQCSPDVSPKKRAIQVGVEAAVGEIIFTIDADCWASPNWISQMISYFEPEVGVTIGFVGFSKDSENNFFYKIQSLEFIGLTMAGIGSIGAGDPIIANGANLVFRRNAFKEVEGYRGEDHVISGDDDLLLQKIDQRTNWKISASISPATFVYTHPVADFNSFLEQRIRWASKGLIYKKVSLVLFLLSTYLLYLLLFISIPFALLFPLSYPYPLIVFFIKLAVDFLLIFKGTVLVGRKDLRKYFLITEILQIPYIIYVGFAGILKKFEWKGR
jgi:cellulose synthase/poly-beta-1,6-N-acetylglucosamine synthase-like glycosyltransferase